MRKHLEGKIGDGQKVRLVDYPALRPTLGYRLDFMGRSSNSKVVTIAFKFFRDVLIVLMSSLWLGFDTH